MASARASAEALAGLAGLGGQLLGAGFASPFSAALALPGILWASPNDLIGLGLGTLGVIMGGDAPILGNNAIEFPNNPATGLFPHEDAITFGNTIMYASGVHPSDPHPCYDNGPYASLSVDHIGDHEEGHTYQYEVLGPAFIPLYGIATLAEGANSGFERGADFYGLTKEGNHGQPIPAPYEPLNPKDVLDSLTNN